MSSRILHFTIGPVQGFVAQARRTRDLWGGSFLLSWLSGIAMQEVLRAGGRIVFPVVHDDEREPTDPLLAAILGKALVSNPRPIIGSIPNRFKAEVPADLDPDKQIAGVVTKTFEKAAEKVWEGYVTHVEKFGNGTRAIWERQIMSFWEIAWVLGENPGNGSDGAWLDARKNWRVPAGLEPEGGDHCTVMHAWQELSGWLRARASAKQHEFWEQTRSRLGLLDLRSDERLCAIAFVKRMLPRLARNDRNIFGWQPDSRNWPSTAYMAAVPWIEKAWGQAPDEAKGLTNLAARSFKDGSFGECSSSIECLKTVDADFRRLDGNAFHLPALANETTTPLRANADRGALISALRAIQDKVGRSASPFYALLLMDGDWLGKLLRSGPETKISAALADFTGQVSDVVSNHNGVTVYAGGDDVLSMLPLPDAIDAACDLEGRYRDSFGKQGIAATLSGAIVYSHFKQPLQAVLEEAHHLLDDVAKKDNGRSSLSIAVLQGAGKNIEWVSTWRVNSESPALQIKVLADRFGTEPQFSTRFFYGLSNLFGLMPEAVERAGKGFELGLNEEQMFRWMVAEYLDNRELKTTVTTVAEAEKRVRELMSVCQYHRYKPQGFNPQASGARLVKFLANPGAEE